MKYIVFPFNDNGLKNYINLIPGISNLSMIIKLFDINGN